MQACIYDEYGPADVVRVGEAARPAIRRDEMLVRVKATAVTTADWRFRASEFPGVFWLPGRLMVGLFRPRNPILGMDFSGVVEDIGPDVTRFRPGDRVFGAAKGGAHAELVAVSESGAVLHKPQSLSDEEAAAIPFGGNSALAFLRDVGGLERGQHVLVVGASGAVGTWAVQLARHFGAEVTGVCSAPNADLVRALGAHRVIDYRQGPICRAGDGYDLVFDTVGVTSWGACKDALAERGLYLPLNGGLRDMWNALVTALRRGKRAKFSISKNTREGLEELTSLIAAGAVRPVVDRVYPMAHIADAHRHVEGRHKRGSVIVSIGAGA